MNSFYLPAKTNGWKTKTYFLCHWQDPMMCLFLVISSDYNAQSNCMTVKVVVSTLIGGWDALELSIPQKYWCNIFVFVNES